MTLLATFKHISSKNADYGAAEAYLTFESSPWSASSYAHGAPGVKKPPLSVRKAAAICFL